MRYLLVFVLAAVCGLEAMAKLQKGTQPVVPEYNGVNVVFIGNSITFGAKLPSPATQAAPARVKEYLQSKGYGDVEVVNIGKSGSTTVDWLPSNNTLYKRVADAMKQLTNKDALTIFSIMLGTNDSADEGPKGAPLSNEDYCANISTIIDSLHAQYPNAFVMVHSPLWYSTNTHNTSRYMASGLQRLIGYRSALKQTLFNNYVVKRKNYVVMGDTAAYYDLKENYERWYTPEAGKAGTFYLHPNVDGAKKLAGYWGREIAEFCRYKMPKRDVLPTGARLYIYPAQGTPQNKAIVVCPGGGYSHLAHDHEGMRFAAWYSAQGITAIVLLYNLPNGDNTVPLNDAKLAIAYAREHSAELGGYTKVGIMGSSAGGHLCSTAATHLTGADAPDFHILLYPVITMEQGLTHQGTRDCLLTEERNEELEHRFSNEERVTPQTSRAFIMLSSDDRVVPAENSLRYYSALLKNKVPATMHIYPTGGHGWGINDSFLYKPSWQTVLQQWLKTF